MPNKILVTDVRTERMFGSLPQAALFRSVYPFNETNVYMKLDTTHRGEAVLLTTGNVYMFPNDKQVNPLDRDQSVIIEQV